MNPNSCTRLPFQWFLCENHLCIYNFVDTLSNIIHPPYPLHWILGFKLFGDTFPFSILFYQPKKECLCFFLYISEMGVELAGSEQIVVQDFMMLL